MWRYCAYRTLTLEAILYSILHDIAESRIKVHLQLNTTNNTEHQLGGKADRFSGCSTCRQGESDQVSEEVTGEIALALVQRRCDLPADLLRQLGTHHGGNTLCSLLANLQAQQFMQISRLLNFKLGLSEILL